MSTSRSSSAGKVAVSRARPLGPRSVPRSNRTDLKRRRLEEERRPPTFLQILGDEGSGGLPESAAGERRRRRGGVQSSLSGSVQIVRGLVEFHE